MDIRERIVKRVARELRDGDYVNLGIGLPTVVGNYIPPGIFVKHVLLGANYEKRIEKRTVREWSGGGAPE